MLMGGAAPDVLRLDGDSVVDFTTGNSQAGIRFNSNGKVQYMRITTEAGAYTDLYDWVTPTSNAANYKLQWVAVVGLPDTNPGAQNTDFDLTTSRTFEELNLAGVESAIFTIKLYRIGSSTVLKQADFTLEVDGT